MSDVGIDPTSARQIESLTTQLGELTDALVSANDQLLALYQLAGFSAGSLEAGIAADRALNQVQAMIGAASVAFVGEDPHGESAPKLAAAVGGESDDLERVVQSSAKADRARIDRDLPDGRGQILAPVKAGDRWFGTIVARSPRGQRFTTADLKLLEAVANHLAVILELSALHEDAVHRALVQRDHDTASALAQAALERAMPAIDYLDVAASSRPARSAGGDFYAVGRASTGMYLALGDVSGKGLPAALVMTTAISATQGAFERHPQGDAGAVLSDIDNQLADYLSETGMFITMAVAHIDPATGVLQVTNAGQSPVVVIADDDAQPITADGPPIGVLDPRQHGFRELPFNVGDALFIGSDGCTDQNGLDSTMYGEERVYDLVKASSHQPADDIIQRVLDSVAAHGAGCEQDDDLTAIVVRKTEKDGT